MAVYICAANIRNSFVTEKSFLIKFLFLMLFSLFPPFNVIFIISPKNLRISNMYLCFGHYEIFVT